MFEGKENPQDKSAEKKDKPTTAIITAVITLASSTGLLGFFGIFSGEHSNRNVAGLTVPATHQFITKETRQKVVDLKGDWKFRLGDDLAWASPTSDDQEWETMPVPAHWDEHGHKDYDGYAWYRKTFSIRSEDTSKPLFLYLGRIDDVDDVYINGNRIGGRGRTHPEYLTAWNQNRIYRLSSDLLKADSQNLIAVRVYDDQHGGGIVGGPIGIFTSDLPQPLIDLAGEWQFQRGDNLDWAHSASDGFVPVRVPLVWEANGFPDYDGFAWYQKRFKGVLDSGEETLALVLGKIDDTDQVFLNGELIGSTGKLDGHDRQRNGDFWRKNRVYEFPTRLMKDENLLAVRVHDSMGSGGIYSGPVGIMRVEDVRAGTEIAREARGMTWNEVWDWLLGRDQE